ncbi:hypothetical protein C7N77_11795 [Aeromonas rivipollensis]|nr:hypothetical protein C7N77_11795 [Aeromonas rivipollensis]
MAAEHGAGRIRHGAILRPGGARKRGIRAKRLAMVLLIGIRRASEESGLTAALVAALADALLAAPGAAATSEPGLPCRRHANDNKAPSRISPRRGGLRQRAHKAAAGWDWIAGERRYQVSLR